MSTYKTLLATRQLLVQLVFIEELTTRNYGISYLSSHIRTLTFRARLGI